MDYHPRAGERVSLPDGWMSLPDTATATPAELAMMHNLEILWFQTARVTEMLKRAAEQHSRRSSTSSDDSSTASSSSSDEESDPEEEALAKLAYNNDLYHCFVSFFLACNAEPMLKRTKDTIDFALEFRENAGDRLPEFVDQFQGDEIKRSLSFLGIKKLVHLVIHFSLAYSSEKTPVEPVSNARSNLQIEIDDNNNDNGSQSTEINII
ncbi:hypothetical protein FZEAL_9574 [Fusarium zealandicum]|uniref:Uncharacterized protein n=1 Tax=Fusarium zealandicum TaxID=1053134 RepID=A0A8H4XEV2_9HYPO|nr:hypothetical protein FZEAL_9574 [Fusarium zealandicum]